MFELVLCSPRVALRLELLGCAAGDCFRQLGNIMAHAFRLPLDAVGVRGAWVIQLPAAVARATK